MTVLANPGPTAHPQVDLELHDLRAGAARWASLPLPDKIALLMECREGVYRQAARWTAAAAEAKGLTDLPLAGEEAIGGPWAVLYALNAYAATLSDVDRYGRVRIDPKRVRRGIDGQTVVDVFPANLYDRVLLDGIRAEVWMHQDVTGETLDATTATWYRQTAHEPRVALVLGAGNISSIAPLDVLYKLVADGTVCILKMNPVNHYLGPIFEDAFAPLVREGYLRFAYGGAEVGKYLCSHPAVDEIHITGSDKTHDAIVFGDGADAADRKRRNEPLLNKPITSELGNVSPTIVVPGPWSDADVRFQAENVVTQKLHNGGFNCIASQVLILPKDWARTPDFIEALYALLKRVGDRPAYYPGAAQRCRSLALGHRDVRAFGRDEGGFVARTVAALNPADDGEAAFTTEAFSSFLGIVALPGDTQSYLREAVAFANDRLWGTLGGNLIAHPATMREHRAAFDRAVADLRYGCVGVNAWTGVGFLLCQTPWGAYPGHTLADVRSGIGVVHNSYLFSRSQKSVVYAPFAPFPRSLAGYGASLLPKPPWFVTNRNQLKIGMALCDFEMHKSPLKLARIAALAMTG
ncbi:MAG TPA: aldehyde dehydrogenase family protein [Candidatus Baltobacteraceae bacterium]|jgi:aldehyde dehydrogenase (NAD(P)+)|nr:aldehyde dehydrogenase family protein [Candidatus Baltobacteraceae bacterium]